MEQFCSSFQLSNISSAPAVALNFELELSNARLTITHLNRVIQAYAVELASKEIIIQERDNLLTKLNEKCIEKDRLISSLREKSNRIKRFYREGVVKRYRRRDITSQSKDARRFRLTRVSRKLVNEIPKLLPSGWKPLQVLYYYSPPFKLLL